MNFKRAIANSVIVLTSCLILFFVLEIAIRTYSAFFLPMMRVPDELLGWRKAADREKVFVNENGEENLIVQNANGHRGTYYSSERSAGKFRILVLGDSFTAGMQVNEDELFTARLEASNDDWEVLNTGVGSYSTVQQYLYLISEGMEFNPDLILLMFYNNDLAENCAEYSPGIGPRPYARIDDSGNVSLIRELDYDAFAKFAIPAPFYPQLLKYSYFYYFLNSRIYQRLLAAQLRDYYRADREVRKGCSEFPILFHFLQRIADTGSERNIDFMVSLIPSSKEVASNQADAHNRILNFCVAAELQCMTLLEPMHTSLMSGDKPYFDQDIHWTSEGHAVAAQSIENFIRNARQAYVD
jgi:hypothetical protein